VTYLAFYPNAFDCFKLMIGQLHTRVSGGRLRGRVVK